MSQRARLRVWRPALVVGLALLQGGCHGRLSPRTGSESVRPSVDAADAVDAHSLDLPPAGPPPTSAIKIPKSRPARVLFSPARLAFRAPPRFDVLFSTNRGEFTVRVERSWAPVAADRFYNLVRGAFFDQMRFHRVHKGISVEFGIHGHPAVSQTWMNARLPDEPTRIRPDRGWLSFVSVGPSSRSTEIVIDLAPKRRHAQRLVPFGRVISGIDTLDRLEDGDGVPGTAATHPSAARLRIEGHRYLEREFPRLDFIWSARLVKASKPPRRLAHARSYRGAGAR
ncbi:MAG TPA: peptidylprolyl isomerase [Polyangia bacterium]